MLQNQLIYIVIFAVLHVVNNPEMEQDGMNWSDPHFVEGTLFHIITDKSNQTAGDQSGYYNIKTWIEWEDKNIGETAFKHIAFEVDQAVLIK